MYNNNNNIMNTAAYSDNGCAPQLRSGKKKMWVEMGARWVTERASTIITCVINMTASLVAYERVREYHDIRPSS